MISKTIGFRGTQHFQTHPIDILKPLPWMRKNPIPYHSLSSASFVGLAKSWPHIGQFLSTIPQCAKKLPLDAVNLLLREGHVPSLVPLISLNDTFPKNQKRVQFVVVQDSHIMYSIPLESIQTFMQLRCFICDASPCWATQQVEHVKRKQIRAGAVIRLQESEN